MYEINKVVLSEGLCVHKQPHHCLWALARELQVQTNAITPSQSEPNMTSKRSLYHKCYVFTLKTTLH